MGSQKERFAGLSAEQMELLRRAHAILAPETIRQIYADVAWEFIQKHPKLLSWAQENQRQQGKGRLA